ncbi:MAG: hypothetical protein QOH07_2322 [Mycobacterium sp.]|jgi:hypothetical protein|nr:hypothetical protein [Mycobacterium sp.]
MSLAAVSVAPEAAVPKFAMQSTSHHPFTFSHSYCSISARCVTQ